MIAAVIAIHTDLFRTVSDFDIKTYQFSHYHVRLFDIINFNLLTLAVPTFFVISLFLFFAKVSDSRSYFRPRMVRLFYLYGFWVVLWCLHFGGFYAFASHIRHGDIAAVVEFIVRGGGGILYFFFSLIFLTFIAYYSIRLSRAILWLLLVLSLSLLWLLPLIVIHYSSVSYLVAYWNPINFLPYVFIANLVFHYIRDNRDSYSRRFKIAFIVILIVTIISAILEWLWLPNQNFFAYNPAGVIPGSRLSVAGGTALVFLASFLVKKPAWKWVRFLADYTLGMYCLHYFVLSVFFKIFPMAPATVVYVSVFLLSLAAAYLARRAFGKRLI